ncbi:Autophagy protein 22 [Sorochytrium milnesiophthora]
MHVTKSSVSEEAMVGHTRDMSGQPETTVQELRGWYAYNWAAEVASAAGFSVFMPLVLEDLTRQVGVLAGTDTSCTTVDSSHDSDCMVKFGSGTTNVLSYTLYITSISVAMQALTFISVGSLADFGPYRKLMLRMFATSPPRNAHLLHNIQAGALCFALFAAATPSSYQLAAALAILTNVCFGGANMFYNAYLPLLTECHPTVRQCRQEVFGSDRITVSDQEKMSKYLEVTTTVGNSISTKGFVSGYASGVLVLILGAAIVWLMKQTTFSMQLVLTLVGVWWFVWAFWTWRTLQVRPGPRLPAGAHWATYSWLRLGHTVKQWKRIPNLFTFLISFFLYSDGSNTITSIAVLYGKTTLKLSNTDLIIVAIITPLACGIGNLVWLRLQRLFGWTTHKTLFAILCLLFLIPIYGTLGIWLPLLRTKIEVYILSLYFGMLLGSWQSYSRVVMSELIPRGFESEFFSLYEITNKGSSWIGSFVTGAITSATGDIRYAWIFLLFMLGLPLPLMYRVNVLAGKEQARLYSMQESLAAAGGDDDIPLPSLAKEAEAQAEMA